MIAGRTVTIFGEPSKGFARYCHVPHGDGEVFLEFGAPADVDGAYP